MVASVEEDRCPLCPSSGPPSHPSGLAGASPATAEDRDGQDDSLDLVWIACSKCHTWYHSACLLLSPDESDKATVPQSVRDEVKGRYEGGEEDKEAFHDWTVWINRWYCRSCLEKHSATPRAKSHPLVASLKPSAFSSNPPRSGPVLSKRNSTKRSASSTKHTPAQSMSTPPPEKKARRASPSGLEKTPSRTPESASATAMGPPSSTPGTASASGSGSGSGSAVGADAGVAAVTTARPKRLVAMNRPDYHAMHHHISTPTAKWLDLIANPEKYNAVIREGDFPRLPGNMVTRDWIESNPTSSYSSSAQNTSTPGSGPSKYPDHLPPTLFYGPTREPLIIKQEDGGFEAMGGKLPPREFTVHDVAKSVGGDRMVDVIDVATQQSAQWTLSQWSEYIKTSLDPEKRPNKVYNIISLEITGTELAKKVRPPRLVREIDWVDNFWYFGPGGKNAAVDENKSVANGVAAGAETATEAKPGVQNGHPVSPIPNANGLRAEEATTTTATAAVGGEGGGEVEKKKFKRTSPWPKVQLYCLMGTKGSWTDWHVDFAASSVYYTIHTGSKVFYFIRPTEKNMKAYAEWSGSYEMQQNTWLGNMCDEVRKVTLVQGDTMIIPAGYIHAVYTPMDSIVFGGNFVHSYDIPAQLRLRQIEIDTKVPLRFRFPFFDRLCWYVAHQYCADLRASRAFKARSVPVIPHPRILHGLQLLAGFLVSQVVIIENESISEDERSKVHGRVPSDLVKDPSGLARELKWRVERELGENPDTSAGDGSGLVGGSDGLVSTKPGGAGNPGSQTTSRQIHEVDKGKETETDKSKAKKLRIKPPGSRISGSTVSEWTQTDLPAEISHYAIRTPPPTSTAAEPEADAEATIKRVILRQNRRRTKELPDGTLVLEEQEVVFTEQRTVWDSEDISAKPSLNEPMAVD